MIRLAVVKHFELGEAGVEEVKGLQRVVEERFGLGWLLEVRVRFERELLEVLVRFGLERRVVQVLHALEQMGV